MSHIAVLGAGAFGTALAVALADAGHQVALVARTTDHARDMAERRENRARLPGITLPEGITPTDSLPADAPIVLAAIPTQALAPSLARYAKVMAGRTIVACNKGIDLKSGLGPTGIIAAACRGAQVAALSGPGFAIDIAQGLPTALTLAMSDETAGKALQQTLSSPNLRLYLSTDVTGVETGGALKNVIAIAAGICIGAGLGESARAALMTRGYAELKRFATARGAEADTLSGLSGFGDLVLTCTSEKSRNFAHGLAIGAGRPTETGKTVEGASTAQIVAELARKMRIDVPITDLVTAILDGRIDIDTARSALLARPLKME